MTNPGTNIRTEIQAQATVSRVRVFVDYWNLQLGLNEREASSRGVSDYRFQVRWAEVGPWLARKACAAIGLSVYSFEGVII